MTERRTYELKRRAERQEETRQRIVAAAVELHTTLGPARTTVQAIAEKAGVTRPTVYAHFPDAASLFAACSGHVRDTRPPPNPARWQSIADPAERLAAALRDVYAYYELLEQLLENVERDAATMPVIAEIRGHRLRYLEGARDVVLAAWALRGTRKARLARAVGHALEFTTWRSLVRSHGCTTDEAVELMVALARAVTS